jgi:hypothetical protein
VRGRVRPLGLAEVAARRIYRPAEGEGAGGLGIKKVYIAR